MKHWHAKSEETPFALKAAMLVLVAIFAVIGVIGLILPIIPGIVFLGLAALLLSRVSSRFATYLQDFPVWRKLTRRWRSQTYLTAGERAKLAVLYAIRSVVDTLDGMLDGASGKKRQP